MMILLSSLFGRKIRVEGSNLSKRILPIVWRGRLYLLGFQHYNARVEFDRRYRVRLIETPLAKPCFLNAPEDRKESESKGFLHVTGMHAKAEDVDALLSRWMAMKGLRNEIALAYGGPREEFDRIKHACKFFIPQNEIWAVRKGGVNSYTTIIREAAKICLSKNLDGMMYSDGDAWPCAWNYIDKLCLPPWRKGADFSAARIRDVTHTSLQFPESPEHSLPKLEDWVRRNGLEDPNAPVRILFHAGSFMFFSASILRKFLTCCADEPPIHDELAISTYMLYLGANYCTYEDFGIFDTDRWLRYRPNLTQEEFVRALDMKLPLVHPVKDDRWIRLYDERKSDLNVNVEF